MTIVEELRQNRESGAKRLESEYKAGLLTLARNFCVDESDAEELVNRTFAAVVEGIDDYLEQSAFFAWMCQILTSLHSRNVRRKSAQNIMYPDDVPDVFDFQPPSRTDDKTDWVSPDMIAIEPLRPKRTGLTGFEDDNLVNPVNPVKTNSATSASPRLCVENQKVKSVNTK